ncbi:hypothetical protein GQ43DRAFT_109257 [Delitschia confertaspora ATCC 74209]|uniref:Uncharacterized protein n=1 Tax=Delitschia confertaspora ATCC 74209 TaxID=1513339 RepID=A0A9P4JT60_9PLEO|nr:hypothetical protein GQ43DRAFT_109257 [Delitschia confertaspora ATCC 74209]
MKWRSTLHWAAHAFSYHSHTKELSSLRERGMERWRFLSTYPQHFLIPGFIVVHRKSLFIARISPFLFGFALTFPQRCSVWAGFRNEFLVFLSYSMLLDMEMHYYCISIGVARPQNLLPNFKDSIFHYPRFYLASLLLLVPVTPYSVRNITFTLDR